MKLNQNLLMPMGIAVTLSLQVTQAMAMPISLPTVGVASPYLVRQPITPPGPVLPVTSIAPLPTPYVRVPCQGVPSDDVCSADGLCTNLMNSIAAANANPSAFMTCGEILDHVANRLGYGISSADTLLPKNATYSDVRKLMYSVSMSIQNKTPLVQSNALENTLVQIDPTVTMTAQQFVDDKNAFTADVNTAAALIAAAPSPIPPAGVAMKDYCLANGTGAYCAALNSYNAAFGGRCHLDCADSAAAGLQKLKVVRAALGSQFLDSSGKMHDAQHNLNEVILEFWFNHFNVDYMKAGNVAQGVNGYEPTIFANQYGTFKDLLIAVETHPAMIQYLDNQTNIFNPVDQTPGNQNLGRELLELHTIGKGPQTDTFTNSPYNQNDVVNAALILGGMVVVWDNYNFGSFFDAQEHQPAALTINKVSTPSVPPVVMGKTYDFNLTNYAIGQTGRARLPVANNGQLTTFLTDLANHEYTKRNICTQLSSFFVRTSSLKSASLTACLNAYGVNGNLQAMYTAILTDPSFWNSLNYRSGTQNPLEFAVSLARKEGVRITDLSLPSYGTAAIPITFGSYLANSIINGTNAMGLSIRKYTYPTGYLMDGASWLSKGYLNGAALTSFNETNLHLGYSKAAQDSLSQQMTEFGFGVYPKLLNQVVSTSGYEPLIGLSSIQVNSCTLISPTSLYVDVYSSGIADANLASARTMAEFTAASSFGIQK
jgi:uncharacterized protein (DUF1800 family)